MSLLIIVGCIWSICKLISAASAAAKERARQAEMARVRAAQERQRAEQARMREEWKAAQAAERERVRQMVALEKEQARQAKEQERIAKEQEKQAEVLAKHEEQIAKLEFRLSTAESDIAHWNEQIAALYAILDMEQLELAGTVNGSKEQMKHQKKIITLNNQIHAAENRLNKAKFEKSFCEDKLAS